MADRPLVLLWIPEPGPYRQALERAGLDRQIDLAHVPPAETPAPDLLARAQAMLAYRSGPGVLPRMPALRWIQALTAGVEGWLALPDLPAGITLTCARGTHRVHLPENILGALVHLSKPDAGIALEQNEHRRRRRVSETLAGTTLGILGLGVIGQELARKAEALEMRVIGTRKSPAPLPHVAQVYGSDGTDEVLAASDWVLLLLPVTPETRGFMNAARLKRMKPTAHLLNFGRGELVVDADLIEAVKARTIAGAVLDVFTTEPLPAEHPFWGTENILVLPHIGGLHPGRDHIVARLFVDNVERFLAGKPLRETVERARGY
jgi:phosphoglycerate dehydrogenase-like enzyme